MILPEPSIVMSLPLIVMVPSFFIVMLALPSLGQLSTNVAEYGDYATETPQPLKDAAGNIVFPGFPADDLYYFRLYSIGAQIILWATIALGFAPFARRLLGDRSETVAA